MTIRKSIQNPSVESERPIIVGVSVVRPGHGTRKIKARRRNILSSYQWCTMEITIPKDIAIATGMQMGTRMVFEAFADGRVRMYPAGETVDEVERMI